jgi:hypothetical protein
MEYNDAGSSGRASNLPNTGLDTIYPTRLSGNSVRLLKLFPGSKTKTIQCELVQTPIDDVPEYEAISYVWGDPNIRVPIQCNGTTLDITVSLAEALRRFRLSDSTRLLWADAICINQSDNLERNHQVGLMRHIYSSAATVLIWLGDDDLGLAKHLFGFIMFVSAAQQRHDDSSYGSDGRSIETIDPISQFALQVAPGDLKRESDFCELDYHDLFVSEDAEPLSVFQRPWFTRIWCVQEIGLARSALFACGDEEIDWIYIEHFFSWSLAQEKLGRSVDVFFGIGQSPISRLFLAKHGSGKFPTCLSSFRSWKATDPRDKVFALSWLSIREDGESWVEVDYEKSVGQVYTDTALSAMKCTGDLYILRCINHGDQYHPETDYPSWVPRWTGQPSMLRWESEKGTADASNNRRFEQSSKNPGILQLKGVTFDHVSLTTLFGYLENRVARTVSVLKAIFKFELENLEEQGHRNRRISLAMTLTGGKLSTCSYSDVETGGLSGFDDHFIILMEAWISGNTSSLPDAVQAIHSCLMVCCNEQRFFVTAKRYMGLGPACMRDGDIIVVLYGGDVPFVLRPISDTEYAFMGGCVIFDIMHGEIFKKLDQGEEGVEERTFVLV